MAVIKRVRLSEIAELVTKGTTPTTLGYEFQDTGVNFLKIECFSEKGDYIQNKATHISEECHEKLKRSQLKEGDILFSIAGVIGRVAIVTRNMLPANINQALAIIRIKKDDIYLPYVKLILTSPLIKKQFERKKQGVAQLNISLKDINELEIPLPEIGKQIEYANSFKKVEKLIYTRQYQLQKLDELVKARFVEMFGAPDRNPMNWETAELKHHLEIVGGFAFRSDGFTGSGIPVLRIGNINSGRFLPVNMVFWPEDSSLARYKIHPGDLVMSLTGTVGKNDYGNVCILSDEYPEYYLNQRNAKLAIKATLNKHYLSEILKFSSVKKRLTGISRGVRQANISNGDILTLCVPIPPITLQEQFAAFVEQTCKSKVAVQKSLDEAQLLFDSLMQQYFG